MGTSCCCGCCLSKSTDYCCCCCRGAGVLPCYECYTPICKGGFVAYPALPRMHSVVQRLRQDSFQAGTWCRFRHTVRRQASVHASPADTPHTVTQELGVGSFDKPPIRRSSLSEVHTRSHTKDGSVPSSEVAAAAALARFCSSFFDFPPPVSTLFITRAGTATPAAHHACTIRTSDH